MIRRSAQSTVLALTAGAVLAGCTSATSGHLALVLVFKNISRTTTCELIGYPGVDLVTASGATVAHLTRTLRGMARGEPAGVPAPHAVVLALGASASTLAEASNVPQGGITDGGNCSLLITVPNQYVAVPGGTAAGTATRGGRNYGPQPARATILGDVTRVRFERLTVQIGPAVVTAPQR